MDRLKSKSSLLFNFNTFNPATIWYVDNSSYKHRDDGPAVLEDNGWVEWWYKNKRYSLEGWLETNEFLNEEDRKMFRLKYEDWLDKWIETNYCDADDEYKERLKLVYGFHD